MNYKVTFPTHALKTTVNLPSSKSISNRALIINALSDGRFAIENLSDSDDTQTMIKALKLDSDLIDIGAAGTAMRFLTAFLATSDGKWALTGSERMKKRPIGMLVEALRAIGAQIEYIGDAGFPPLRIIGRRLKGGTVRVPASISSQFISALLMIAPQTETGLTVELEGEPVSLPYIKLTVEIMKTYGAEVEWDGNRLKVAPQRYTSTPFRVEADWSAASYWYSMVALASEAEVRMEGLTENSLQGDAAVAAMFSRLGVATFFEPSGIRIVKSGIKSRCFDYDFVSQPDLAQTFAVCCCLSDVPFSFGGLQTLKIKETDRIAALINELRKLGYMLEEGDGTLSWKGERCKAEPEAAIMTYDDHRMAMSFAPSALTLSEGIEIAEPQVTSKSYPQFWNELKKAGFAIEERRSDRTCEA